LDEVITSGAVGTAVASNLTTQLAAQGRAVSVLDSIPDSRPTEYVVCTRIGGSMLNPFIDSPVFEFECFAASRADAESLAELVRGLVHAMRGEVVSGLAFGRVREVGGPVYLRHPTAGDRFKFSAAIGLRRKAI
jgi:hypothetical protein